MTGTLPRNLALALLCAAVLAGCSSPKPMRVEPAVLSQSYDYTKPVDAAGKSRPVYILPTINYGWNPARTNDAGEWIGGHYTATVVEEGRWATLEEAEMAGKPYIYAGDSAPITPIPREPNQFQSNAPGQGPGPTGGGQAEINISNLAERIKKLEADQPKLKEHFDSDEFLMAAATQRASDTQAGKNQSPIGQKPMVEVEGLPAQNGNTPNPSNYSANNMVEVNRGGDLGSSSIPRVDSTKSISIASAGRASTIVIQPRPPGTQETYTVPGSKDPLFVDYGANDRVTITYRGVSQDAQFTNQRREVLLSPSPATPSAESGVSVGP
ncbi:MAG: hypothetical protein PW734_11330 [Verrucomicrobium sp.]|nr:hypothetical protein [Verrucomicrobium sp.]